MVKVKVREQKITKQYAVYNGDCCEVVKGIPDDSVGLSVFSPPFADLYTYSDELEDMGNSSGEEFIEHFDFLVGELVRVTMPGRVVAVHCMDLPTFKRNGDEIGLRDFSGDIIRLFQRNRMTFHSRHCIWKDPLIAATRTHALGLQHKQIVKDSAQCRMGVPDYLLAFRKPGDNPKPVTNENGLTEYHGGRDIPREYARFQGWKDQGTNKRSHWIWQQYASPVWDDVRQTRVLPYVQAREEDDQKHICPLQLDVIERCVALWSAPGDVVFTPFMGVGSEVYVAVKNGRYGLGAELKGRYYRQALKNLQTLDGKTSRRSLTECDE